MHECEPVREYLLTKIFMLASVWRFSCASHNNAFRHMLSLHASPFASADSDNGRGKWSAAQPQPSKPIWTNSARAPRGSRHGARAGQRPSARGLRGRHELGMISWEIPLARYPVTYNKQPLTYAGWPRRRTTARRLCRNGPETGHGQKLSAFPQARCVAAARGGRGDRLDPAGNPHSAL